MDKTRNNPATVRPNIPDNKSGGGNSTIGYASTNTGPKKHRTTADYVSPMSGK